jgi:site-specific DNA-cytosine methylase
MPATARLLPDGQPIAFGSVCSGMEAASQAMRPLGWVPAYLSEIEDAPVSVLRHRHQAHDLRAGAAPGTTALWGDFTALRPRHMRRFGLRFPDDYSLVPHRGAMISDSARYRMLGNSMAVPVIAWLAQRVEDAIFTNIERNA